MLFVHQFKFDPKLNPLVSINILLSEFCSLCSVTSVFSSGSCSSCSINRYFLLMWSQGVMGGSLYLLPNFALNLNLLFLKSLFKNRYSPNFYFSSPIWTTSTQSTGPASVISFMHKSSNSCPWPCYPLQSSHNFQLSAKHLHLHSLLICVSGRIYHIFLPVFFCFPDFFNHASLKLSAHL